jgi:hypothetical protein
MNYTHTYIHEQNQYNMYNQFINSCTPLRPQSNEYGVVN